MNDNNYSVAVLAHQQQNLSIPTEKNPNSTPETTRFPGHDIYQNGLIENGSNCTFYVQATDNQIEATKNHQASFSGFATDYGTCKNCIDPETNKLDANKLSETLQTSPGRADRSEPWSYRSNVAAFDVNWDKLNAPENADLKARLCDQNGNLKVAYGTAEANTHWGDGGGNQYFTPSDNFNDAVNRGIFEYNDNKAFRESNGSLQRSDVSDQRMRHMEDLREANVERQFSSCQDKSAKTDIEKAQSLNQMTPEKASAINSQQAASPMDGTQYMAKPDPAYSNLKPSDTESKKDRLSNLFVGSNNANPDAGIANGASSVMKGGMQ